MDLYSRDYFNPHFWDTLTPKMYILHIFLQKVFNQSRQIARVFLSEFFLCTKYSVKNLMSRVKNKYTEVKSEVKVIPFY